MRAPAHPVVGILGGMGPEATVELMRRVIAATPARDDGDHLHMIADCNPHVPSRIAALVEGRGADPSPELAGMARRLETAGATMLAIACNTAHAYGDDIRSAVAIPLLDMIALTAGSVAALALRHRRVGILASSAVLKLGLYDEALARHGIATLAPVRQHCLMGIIRDVKRGRSGETVRARFVSIAEELASEPVDLLLIACTELSVIADAVAPDTPCLDALDILAREIVSNGRRGSQPERESRRHRQDEENLRAVPIRPRHSGASKGRKTRQGDCHAR